MRDWGLGSSVPLWRLEFMETKYYQQRNVLGKSLPNRSAKLTQFLIPNP